MGQVGFPLLARVGSDEMRGHARPDGAPDRDPDLPAAGDCSPSPRRSCVPWLFGPAWAPRGRADADPRGGGAVDAGHRRRSASALMASGRPRALLGFGVGHFAAYAGAVLARHAVRARRRGRRRRDRPHGLHGRGLRAHAPRHATSSGCATCGPTSGRPRSRRWAWSPSRCRSARGCRAAGTPTLVQLVAVTLAGLGAYALTLRLTLPGRLRHDRRAGAARAPVGAAPAPPAPPGGGSP